eukprot:6191769-Pleurochrysis_carterae.AAC.4
MPCMLRRVALIEAQQFCGAGPSWRRVEAVSGLQGTAAAMVTPFLYGPSNVSGKHHLRGPQSRTRLALGALNVHACQCRLVHMPR